MNKTQRKRLLVLARFLERVVDKRHRDKFNMNMFTEQPWSEDAEDNEYSCQTAACAAGWAMVVPELKAQGLTSLGGYRQYPMFDGVFGYDACVLFFGTLDPFNPSSYRINNPTPRTVANALRRAARSA